MDVNKCLKRPLECGGSGEVPRELKRWHNREGELLIRYNSPVEGHELQLLRQEFPDRDVVLETKGDYQSSFSIVSKDGKDSFSARSMVVPEVVDGHLKNITDTIIISQE